MTPLEWVYRAAGEDIPVLRDVAEPALPEPHRDLLAHDADMTSTLEEFVGQPLVLRLIQSRLDGGSLYREVVLVGLEDGSPAEFGAIRIFVDRIHDAPARRRVMESIRPLGGILRDHAIAHRCRPTGFFSVTSDAIMRRAFTLSGDHELFGRHNLLYGEDGLLLAEVTEILPPVFTRRTDGRA